MDMNISIVDKLNRPNISHDLSDKGLRVVRVADTGRFRSEVEEVQHMYKALTDMLIRLHNALLNCRQNRVGLNGRLKRIYP